MLKISRTLVYEPFILEAIQGARLSWASTHKSDSEVVISGYGQRHKVVIGPEDEKLIKNRLLGGAVGEDKFLRAIPVSVWFEAPLRWFFDADTYKIGTVKQSSSLMHYFKSRGELTAANFTETTDPRLIDIANEKYRAWVAAGGKTNFTSREWEEFQDSIGRGYLYTAHWSASYAVLRNAYFQRRYHRQGEWREFCNWVETLPHAWLITYQKERTSGKAES